MRLSPTLTLAALIVSATGSPALARHHHRDHAPTRLEQERRNERNGLHSYYGGYGDAETVWTDERRAPPPRLHGPRDHGPVNRDAKPPSTPLAASLRTGFDNGAPVT